MTSTLALHSFPRRRSPPPQLHSHGRRSRPTRSARRHGLNARRRRRHASARLQPERLEQRRLLAFDFVAAFAESPIPFFVAGDTTATPRLAEAPQQVTLRFDPGVQIDPTSIGGSVSFVRSGNGVLGDGNDVSVLPAAPVGSITVGDSPNENELVIRFAETLPDDVYRFTITSGLRSTSGDTATAYQFDVRLDLGAFVTAVVPQPVDRLQGGGLQQRRDQVDVYFNAGDPLSQSSAENPGQYRLVPVSAAGIDGVPVSPTGVTYSASTGKAVLQFTSNAIADGVLYRLEIGPTLVPTTPTPFSFVGSATDDNSSFATATPLGTLGANGITATARIDDRPTVQTPAGTLPLPHQPGTIDEPGHRDTPADSGDHGLANLTTTPSWPIFWPSWVLNRPVDGPVGYYNFRSTYGFDGQGNALINTITETQKQRTREIFESFSRITGLRFVEETRAPYVGLTVVTGDIRAINPLADPASGYSLTGSSRVGTGLFSRTIPVVVMNSSQNWGESEFGGAWAGQAMGSIGYNLGMKHSLDVPSIQGFGSFTETVFPGDYDAIHLKQLYSTTGTDIDLYSFTVADRGKLSAETVAGRPGSTVTSLLDTVLSLYREETLGATTTRTLVARNDDYYGRDSFVGLDLEPGDYFMAVTSTGNDQFNPETADSGYGGRTRGPYELRLGFTPVPSPTNTIVDTRGTQIDGDRDGLPGGTNAFWFKTAAVADTVFVDKLGPATGADGTVAKPFKTISSALAAVNTANAAAPGSKKIVRIVGNPANTPYLVGTTLAGQALPDGATFNVPKGVTAMIDAGAIFKLRSAIIDVGSSQPLPTSSRAEAALQVLGVPGNAVTFTSYNDDSVGGNSDGLGSAAAGGQWGGLVFRQDSDTASKRAFVNAIQQADIRYGGGQVRVDSQVQSFAPIQIESTRPTIAFNTITDSAGAAIAATPNSFEESNSRIGPEIRGNRLTATRNDGPNNTPVLHQNTTNGLFVKIFTRFGSPLEQLDVPARFKSTDIVYVLQENLVISGGAGGYTLDVASNRFASRPTGRLAFDAGVVVKLQNSRIELERGAGQLIAEGGEFNPVIFTSLGDNRYGAGGTFDTNGTLPNVRAAGDWGGIILNAGTRASIDRAYVAFGGGLTPIEGTSDSFNVIEVHQADLRLANTRIERNLSGLAASDRTGRGTNAAATVFIRGAQPIIVGNDFRENLGAVVSINVNSLSDLKRPDVGRSTGMIRRFDRHDDNVGPLIADNVLQYTSGTAAIAGMKIRPEEITVEGVWDDTGMVHVVEDELVVRNFHTATGLRLQSKPDASLVVKLRGSAAGITAEGYGLDIDDRIGGTVQIVGQPGRPVILTSLADDLVGASLDPLGRTVTDTGNDGISTSAPGDWRSLKFLPLSNDRNVSVYVEAERPLTSGREANAVVDDAEDLGVLAPNFATGTNSWESAQEKSGDENRRLGFEVHGFVSPDDPTDVDVYAFQGYAGSEVWVDVDKTASRLDSMVELLDSFGNVLARSTDESVESSVTNDTVVDLTGGLGVTYQLTKTNVVQGTLVGTLFNAVTRLAIQDFSIDPNGTATFYDRLPASPFHATAAILNPASGQVTFTFDNAASATGISASYVYATGALSAATLGLGQSAQRDGWRGGDYYTTNPRDPGMRVILPGTQGQYLRYYVRVRSQPRQDAATLAQFPGANAQERYEASLQSTTFDQPGDPSAGATSGSYELRIRLRQRDEKPGSVVRYADIRFPTVGIDVFGLPRNSLLTGETGETTQTNDTLGDAQYVGNLLESDRNTISVAGELGSATDVDWYQFALNYEQIVGAFGTPAWATVFDIDYADGFRGNLTLAVFDAAGTLLYIGRDSDIRDDQPGTSQGNDFDDLSRGSLGKLDPFIGTVQLPTGAPQGTRADPADPASQLKYYVAVMSNGQLPSQLNATFQTAAGNTLVRLEPITSLKRVVEDHIGFTGYTSQRLPVNQTTIDPNTGAPRPLIDISSKTTLDANVRAFTLADVTLFVSTATGLYTVDAVTGNRETSIRTGIPGVTIGDLDMRTDGKLYAYAGVNNDVNNAGQLIELDTGTGAFVSTSSDGIENVATTPLNFQTTSNTVTALAFRRTNVADYDDLWFIVQDGGDSKLYRAADGGSATTVANATADQTEATSTTLGYRGRLQGVVVTGLQFINDSGAPPTDDVFGVTADGQFITILAGGKVPTDTPDFQATLTPLANFTTQLQTVNATGFRGLAAAPRNLDNGSLSGMFVAVTNNGRLCVIDPVNNVLVPRLEWGPGPNGVGDLFSPAISGVTGITGLAFSPLDVNLWHATERRGDTDRDTVTTADAGHGINATSDKTRIPGDANRTSDFVDNTGTTTDSRTHSENLGGISMYFGLEEYQGNGTPAYLLTGTGRGQYGADPTWHEDLTANAAILNNYNLPGGAYGSLITNSFSLATYASTDNPTLYFNYWLETQGAQSKTDGMRDSARVLISVDQGITWQLLATNNSTRSAAQTTDAELPNVISASSAISAYSNQHVQELFDSANWRQARVDLAKWAGRPDIRLRFDFHTAGEFDRLQTDINGNLVNSISGLANTTGNFGTAERGQNNQFEGFYIDDIVVGLAERGEMVTSAVVDTSVSTVSTPPGAPAQSLQGPYQLEIRRGTEYSALINTAGDMQIFRTFDTNERLVTAAYSATGDLRGDSNLPREQGQFVVDGNIITSAATYGISIDAGARDAVSNTPHPGVARNLPTLNNAGLVPGAVVVNNVVSGSGTAGIRFSGDAGVQPTATVPFGRIVNNTIYGFAQSDAPPSRPPLISIPIVYRDFSDLHPDFEENNISGLVTGMVSSALGANGKPILNPGAFPISSPQTFAEWYTDVPGTNSRVNSSIQLTLNPASGVYTFQDSSFFPVDGMGFGNEGRPYNYHFTSEISTRFRYFGGEQLTFIGDDDVWVFINGVLALDLGGVHGTLSATVSLDANAARLGIVKGGTYDFVVFHAERQTAASTFRIDTTIILVDQGVGVQVSDNAGPTLMNNLFANLATGVSVDASSQRDSAGNERTVVTHSGFSGVTTPVTGVTDRFRVTLPANPFVNAAGGNFYPVAGSPVIDSSLNSLQDRNEFVVVNSPIGVPPSPILAPEKDLYGQVRADDPGQTSSVPGLGLNAFKDLGAIDRVDFSQSPPYLVIIDPQDNGPADVDVDLDEVEFQGVAARNRASFSFQIIDGGAGIDPATVVASAFTVTRDGTTLVSGKDYVFRFTEAGSRVVFTAASVFKPGIYKIVAAATVADRAGNPLRPNNTTTGTTEFEIRLLDVPYAPAWPAPMSPLAPATPLLAGWHDDKTIYLGWNPAFTVLPNLPITQYDVEQSTDNFLTQTTILPPTAMTSLTVPSLINGTSYWFRVRATNALGTGPWSDVIGPIVPQAKPSIALDSDTGSSPTDGITRVGLVNVSGVAAGAQWQYLLPGGTWTSGTGSSFIAPDGTYQTNGVQVRQIVAGFPSVPATNAGQWIIDSAIPAAPVITSVTDNVTPVTGSITSGGFTNDPTPTFTGTAEAGTTLRITRTSGTPSTLIVPVGGTWTYTPPTLTDGSYTFTFVTVDIAENESPTTTFRLTVDTIEPTIPVITSVNDNVSPVEGVIASGGFTNDPTPIFTGSAEAGTNLRITVTGGATTSIIVPADGIWTHTPTLANGSYSFTFVAVDAAGNESPAATFSVTVDTMSPARPVITSVVDDASPGVRPLSNGDTTNDAMPAFQGTAEPSTTLRITANGSVWATITVPSDGIWAYTFTVLPDGPYAFTFVAIDAAGNESPAATFSLTIDTVAPLKPDITDVTDNVSPVTGSITSGGFTNDPTPTFTGTAEAGATLRITVNGGTPTSITVPANRIWTYTPTLANGSYSFSFIAVDAAGNESPAATFSLTVDTIAPTTPVITSVNDDMPPVTGSLASGGITNDPTPTFTGTAEAGATLRITGGTPTSITVPANGVWTHTPTLTSGSYTFTFIAVDAAGNESPAATFILTVDTVAPATPVITSVTDNVSPVTGSITSGGFTNDSTPTFNGTAEAGTTLRITRTSGTPTTLIVPAGGIWTYTPPTLANGSYTFAFISVDAAGNESPAATFSLTVDTIAPTTPVITSVNDNVSPVEGVIAPGGFTNDPAPTFAGTAEAGATLRITGGTPMSITVPANGIWTYTPTLTTGSYTFNFVAIDAAGNESPAATFSLTVDTVRPTTPVITGVTDNVSPVTGSIPSGGSTNDTTPTFTGTAEAGTTLRITRNSGTPTTLTVPAGGTWTYTPPTLTDGSYTFTFIAVDAAGNESPAATFSLTVDTIAPQVTSILADSPNGTYSMGQTIDIKVTFSEAVTVTGAPAIQLNTSPLRSAVYVSGSGTSVFLFRYTIQTGDRSTKLDYTSTASLGGGSFPDAAGNPAALTLPAPGAFLGKNIVVDALIKATVSGLGQWPNDPPDFASAVSAFQVQFNTSVTGFTTTSISLQRLADPGDPTSGRPVSLTGVTVTGSGASWTITLPSSNNPTSLKGRYKIVIGGVGSGIQAGGATMDVPVEWYFDRI